MSYPSCYVGSMKNERLTGGWVAPKFDPKKLPTELLLRWRAAPRFPVLFSDDPLVSICLASIRMAQEIELIYIGGSTPGKPRRISVSLVFQTQTEGGIYVAGFCHDRKANRIFRVDRAMVIHAKN